MANEKKFRCDICEKTFVTLKILKVHVTTLHDRTSNVQCIYCERDFNRASTQGTKVEGNSKITNFYESWVV